MATIVNARDVKLQAYTPRVATTSMSSNIVVSQDQVTGLGLVLTGTKMLFLAATSQVFQIAKSGTVSPASTTISANLKNITATPTLTVVSGTITPAPVFVNGSVTIPYGNMTTDTVLLRLSASQDSVTYTDEITLIKVREGIDGLMGYVTNESHTVAADYLGNVLAYTDAGGYFKVFQGINDVTSLCTFSIPAGGNTSALVATINATTGAYSVTGGYPTNINLATLLLRATFGTVTLDKIFTLSKTKAGASGVRGSRTFYVTLTGATATYSDTLATTTASVEGGPTLNDIVTQYNTSQGFSQSKFYTSAGWVVVNAVVDGNLIVSGTIGATAMQTGVMTADNVLTRGLTVRDSSGNIILSSGTNLDYSKVGGTTKPADNATVGATFGVNVGGQITSANASTYIASAAIGNAQIGAAAISVASIQDAAIKTAHIQDASITNAKVGELNADRITTGTISAGIIDVTKLIGSSQVFSSGDYTYTVPANMTSLAFAIKGGGGGGGGGGSGGYDTAYNGNGSEGMYGGAGGLGGAGGTYRAVITVTPGQSIVVHVGGSSPGGAAGASGAGGTGGSGNASFITISGSSYYGNPGTGGGGGASSYLADVAGKGSTGFRGAQGTNGVGGDGGGSISASGTGGAGGLPGAAGYGNSPAISPGGPGASGRPGEILIESYQTNGLVSRSEWENLMNHMNQRLTGYSWP